MSNRTLHRKIDTRNRFCRTSSLVRRSGMRGLGSARHEVPGSRRLHAGGPSTNRSKMTARARQVLVASLVDGAAPRVHSLPADTAVLLERGFSAEIRPDGREPVSYDYDRVSPQSPWKVLLGAYIREWAMCARLDGTVRRHVRDCETWRRGRAPLSRAAACGRITADVSAAGRGVQQGDGHSLRGPGLGRAAALSRNVELSLLRPGALPIVVDVRTVPRRVQYARGA